MPQIGDARGEYRGLAYRNDAELKAWLAKRPSEAALEPDLPIIDPHHHFWDTPQRGRYLLDELLGDIGGGHNIVATVFLECRSMYRKDGPPEMAPVGEVEFVNGIAAMSASGGYGRCRVAEAIVGHADLTLGARVREVLEAEVAVGGGRFRGIRHGVSWDPHEEIQKYATRVVPPHLVRDPKFREGFAQLAPLGLSFESWQYHPQLSDAIDLARAFPDTTMILNHVGGVLGVGPYAGKDPKAFQPCAVTVGPDGSIYIADGYGSNFILKYDKDRKFVKIFGGTGPEEGKFQACHGIALDTRQGKPLLLVCNRNNDRVEYWDLDGNFVKVIQKDLRMPAAVHIRGDYAVFPELKGRVSVLDKEGNIVARVGDNPNERQRANFNLPMDQWKEGICNSPHGASIDKDGNLIVSEWSKFGRAEKFVLAK